MVTAKTVVAYFVLLAAVPPALASTFQFEDATSYNANTAQMDLDFGINGYLIENFEDTTLINGLSIRYTGNGFNVTQSSLPRVLAWPTSQSGWDGTSLVTSDPANFPPANGTWPTMVTFTYSPGATSIGIGLGGFQSLNDSQFPNTDHRLYVNGVQQGTTLENLALAHGGLFTSSGFNRNTYLIVYAGIGETITSISFENILSVGSPGTVTDVLFFDHLAVRTDVPEPGSLGLLCLGAGLAFAARIRHLSWRRR